MGGRANDLAERFAAFNDEVMQFVQGCGNEDWHKVCSWEKWSVGTTARHIGANHYGAVGLARMIVKGEKLPLLTMEEIIESANRHAEEHGACTRDEVAQVLRENGQALIDFVKGLEDSELERTGYLAVMKKDVSVAQLIETVILNGGSQHLQNMKTAVGA
jgi:hypothetical protein